VPALTYYATALAVIITIAVSWFARSKTPPSGPAATTGVASPAAHISEPTR
jgi:CBS-domain-containing membrane protein